jgi:hypothetical protein
MTAKEKIQASSCQLSDTYYFCDTAYTSPPQTLPEEGETTACCRLDSGMRRTQVSPKACETTQANTTVGFLALGTIEVHCHKQLVGARTPPGNRSRSRSLDSTSDWGGSRTLHSQPSIQAPTSWSRVSSFLLKATNNILPLLCQNQTTLHLHCALSSPAPTPANTPVYGPVGARTSTCGNPISSAHANSVLPLLVLTPQLNSETHSAATEKRCGSSLGEGLPSVASPGFEICAFSTAGTPKERKGSVHQWKEYDSSLPTLQFDLEIENTTKLLRNSLVQETCGDLSNKDAAHPPTETQHGCRQPQNESIYTPLQDLDWVDESGVAARTLWVPWNYEPSGVGLGVVEFELDATSDQTKEYYSADSCGDLSVSTLQFDMEMG